MIVSAAAGQTDQHPLQDGGPMRKLVVNTFVSLDGVMQAPGGPEEDPTSGFEHGGWSVNFWDDQMMQSMGEFMGKPFDLILGRKTYEIFAAHWPYSDEPGAAELNRATKYVASKTLDRLDLVDEFRVWIFPVVLGLGKRLFDEGAPPRTMKLVDSEVSSTGVVIATYQPAGEIKPGSFALEEPTEAELRRRESL